MGFFKKLTLNLVKKKTGDGNKKRKNSSLVIEKFLRDRKASTKGETDDEHNNRIYPDVSKLSSPSSRRKAFAPSPPSEPLVANSIRSTRIDKPSTPLNMPNVTDLKQRDFKKDSRNRHNKLVKNDRLISPHTRNSPFNLPVANEDYEIKSLIRTMYKEDVSLTEEDYDFLKIVRLCEVDKDEVRMLSRLKNALNYPQRLDCLVWTGLFHSRQEEFEDALIYYNECRNLLIEIGPSRYQREFLYNVYEIMRLSYLNVNENEKAKECEKYMTLISTPSSSHKTVTNKILTSPSTMPNANNSFRLQNALPGTPYNMPNRNRSFQSPNAMPITSSNMLNGKIGESKDIVSEMNLCLLFHLKNSIYDEIFLATEEDFDFLRIVRLYEIDHDNSFKSRMLIRLTQPLHDHQRIDCLIYLGLFFSEDDKYQEASAYFAECKRDFIKIGSSRYHSKFLHRVRGEMDKTFEMVEREDLFFSKLEIRTLFPIIV